jgi:hypothetical protein
MINNDNNFLKKIEIHDLHSRKRFKERYPDFDLDLVLQDLLLCVKTQVNIVYARTKGKFKTEYMIFFGEYWRFIFSKDTQTIVTFLPIKDGFSQRKIKEFEISKRKNKSQKNKEREIYGEIKPTLYTEELSKSQKKHLRSKYLEGSIDISKLKGVKLKYMLEYLERKNKESTLIWKDDE